MTDLVASLEGGGTKTDLVWADAAGHLGHVRVARGCNPQDDPHWLVQVRAALNALPVAPRHIVLGIPGYAEVPDLDRRVRRDLATLCPGPHTILNDVALACQSAFPEGGGVLVLAGTGSMAMAVGPQGLHRTGGWGDAYGDEGSAHWIGRQALSLASQMLDGRLPGTGFERALCARLGLPAQDGGFALMGWVQAEANPRPIVASAAAHVDALADEHNPDAQRILTRAALHLHRHAAAAATHAGLGADWPWSLAGSVFRSRLVTQRMTALVGRPAQDPAHSALTGGLIMAARAAHWPISTDWLARLRRAGR